MADIAYILLSGLLFAIIHSITASQQCKLWNYKLGLVEPHYRRVYVLFSVISTMLWMGFIASLPDYPVYHIDGIWWWGLVLLQGIGAMIALAALQPIDGLAFLGIRRFKQDTDPFVIKGIYHYLRHPMYSGIMLIMLAKPEQSINSLTFFAVLCLYFMVGSRMEESRMIAAHPEYEAYRKKVAAFVPKVLY